MPEELHVVWRGRGPLPLPPGRTEEDVIRFEARRYALYGQAEEESMEFARRRQARAVVKAREKRQAARAAAPCQCDRMWCAECLKRRRR